MGLYLARIIDTAALLAKRLDPQVECVNVGQYLARVTNHATSSPTDRRLARVIFYLLFTRSLPLGSGLEANPHHHQRHGQARPLPLLAWVWI